MRRDFVRSKYWRTTDAISRRSCLIRTRFWLACLVTLAVSRSCLPSRMNRPGTSTVGVTVLKSKYISSFHAQSLGYSYIRDCIVLFRVRVIVTLIVIKPNERFGIQNKDLNFSSNARIMSQYACLLPYTRQCPYFLSCLLALLPW